MRRPEGRYSTLAGFVDVGEPLEMAVVREVLVGECWGGGRQATANPLPTLEATLNLSVPAGLHIPHSYLSLMHHCTGGVASAGGPGQCAVCREPAVALPAQPYDRLLLQVRSG